MQKALAERPKTETSNFKSLAAALDGWFDKDLEELPAEKRRLVEDDFGPIPWDRINSEQRKSVAAQLDYQHDPANVAEMQRAFDRWCEMDGIESQIREWELVGAPTALDKATKEDRLSQLRRDLDKMQKVVASPNQPEPEGWRQKFLNSQTAGIRPGDPKPEFIPYPKAMHELRERLGATPEELAVWVWMTPNEGSLAAFLNANELDNPPRFFYDLPMGKEFDYVAPLMRCWFIADDVHRFQPSDRYITGQDLLKRWEKYPGIRVAAFVRAKIEESRLLDIHPIFGDTQWMHPGDESFPPAATALFVKAHVEAIEMEDLGGALADSGKTVPPAAILQVNPPASTETPKERGKRLLNRHTALKASGVRNPTQQLAKEEGITTVRLGQILRAARAAEEKPKHFAFPAPTNKAKKP